MRPRLAPSVAAVWDRHPYARLAVGVFASYDVAFGLVLALSGRARTSSASFATIHDLGGPVPVGAALVVVGLLIFAGTLASRAWLARALFVATFAHLFLASGFLLAARLPDAALTGIPTYLFVAACHGVQCLLHRRSD